MGLFLWFILGGIITGMKYLVFLIIYLLVPVFVFAQVEITEIMYDVEGKDLGREWVEVLNTGSEVVDMTGWKFFEAEQNHKLKIFQGESVLPSGGRAIIAADPAKFLADWSGFSGTIFDSSFSLKKVGESIAIRDGNLNEIDSVFYDASIGAKGDGNSLQKINMNGVWLAQAPTPGAVNTEQAGIATQDEGAPATPAPVQEAGSQQQSSSILWPVEQQIFTHIKEMTKVVVVGTDVVFSGEALGFEREPLENARYLWAFGDGGTRKGEKVLHAYNYPGKYIVILNTSSGKYSASDRINIEVIPADIVVSSVGVGSPADSFVEVKNNTKHELDLSGWRLRAGSNFFIIPQSTIILKNSSIIFSGEYTKFDIKEKDVVELLYANNNKVFTYTWGAGNSVVESKSKVVSPSKSKFVVQKSKEVVIQKEKIVQKSSVVKTKDIETVLDIDIARDKQMVDISNAVGVVKSGIYKWVSAVMGLVIFSIFTFFMIRKEQISMVGASSDDVDGDLEKESDEYEIETI